MPEQTSTRSLESHVQTILSTVIVILLGWYGSTLIDVRDRLIRLEEHQKLVEKRLTDLEAKR